MTISNDSSTTAVSKPAKPDPSVGEVLKAASHAGSVIKGAAVEVAIRGTSMVLLPLYGPVAAHRARWNSIYETEDIFFMEGLGSVTGFCVLALAAMIRGEALAVDVGLPQGDTGMRMLLAASLLTGPALVGGYTGLRQDLHTLQNKLHYSPLAKRISNAKIPVSRVRQLLQGNNQGPRR